MRRIAVHVAVPIAALRYGATKWYSKTDEWVSIDKNEATLGISHHAQEMLSDIVFVRLPKVGDKLTAGSVMGDVESVKASSSIYAPVGGTVVEVNTAAAKDPAIVNKDAEGNGWLVKLGDVGQPEGLLDAVQYKKLHDQ